MKRSIALLAACLLAMLALVAAASAHFTGGSQPPPPKPTDPAYYTVSSAASMDTSDIRFGPRRAVPQLPCRPGDHPETGLQGRVPPADRASGRALLGYNCNLDLVGKYPGSGAGTLESFDECAYFGQGTGLFGTQVLDVRKATDPLYTTRLATAAAIDPWESLRANANRGLLVADSNYNGYLDIYDVSGNCTQPRLVSSTDMSPARGHEGWFSPDGMTYYMSRTGPDGMPTRLPDRHLGSRESEGPRLVGLPVADARRLDDRGRHPLLHLPAERAAQGQAADRRYL